MPLICSPCSRPTSGPVPGPLDLDALNAAAAHVIGTHDFTTFAAVDPDLATRADFARAGNCCTDPDPLAASAPSPLLLARADNLLIYRVTGNGFLHHMVRNLVGTFVQAGAHRPRPTPSPTLLAARNRSAAGPTAPPRPLPCLRRSTPNPERPRLMPSPLPNSASRASPPPPRCIAPSTGCICISRSSPVAARTAPHPRAALRRTGPRGLVPRALPRSSASPTPTSTPPAMPSPNSLPTPTNLQLQAATPFILLSAHLDTVFPAGTPTEPTESDTRILAPGACDNAAGLSGLLGLAAAMRHAELAPAVPILFAANVGEEGEGDLRGMRISSPRSPYARASPPPLRWKAAARPPSSPAPWPAAASASPSPAPAATPGPTPARPTRS